MDIKAQLLEELSHFNMHYIADYVRDNNKRFSHVMELALYEKDPVPARAAWVAEIVTQENPAWIEGYIQELINKLPHFTHPGSRRNSLKILMRTKIPEDYHGILIDICFDWMMQAEKTVAVKVYAMQIIQNHLSLYPELAIELKGVIEDQWEKNSAGFKSRGRKVLKEIEKHQ